MESPLDFWSLFVEYTFGSFWLAVIGIAGIMLVIMGILGKMSMFTVTWYLAFFLLAMTMGAGINLLNVLITIALLFTIWMAWQRVVKE
jgi:hypothetical protein